MNVLDLDFLVIGPQKAGTTWIYEYLRRSKNVCLPQGVKETFFWDKYFNKGLDWYFSHFKKCKSKSYLGEVGPTYFSNIEVPKRVSKYFPDIKIVITLRNPYERTWSLYLHQLRYGSVNGEFKDAIKQDFSIIDSSLYSKHIENWYKYFNKSQIFITSYNKLKKNPEEFMKEIFEFLEIPFFYEKDLFTKKVNKSELPRSFLIAKISNSLAHKLRSYKLYSIIEFAKKIGLREIIFSGRKQLPKPTKQDLDIMESYFKEDLERLQSLIDLNINKFSREKYEEKLLKK